MTKHPPRESLETYSARLGYEFHKGPSAPESTHKIRTAGDASRARPRTELATARPNLAQPNLSGAVGCIAAARPWKELAAGESVASENCCHLIWSSGVTSSSARSRCAGASASRSTSSASCRGWTRERKRVWRGRFKSAKALRLPPQTRWDDVEAREIVDTVTGELLESVHVLANPAIASDAGRRLDRVRDIETLATLAETAGDDEAELVDLTLEDSGAESDRPIEVVDWYGIHSLNTVNAAILVVKWFTLEKSF